MKDFLQLAEDAGARAPIVLPIPTAADPTTFPGTVSAETGMLMLMFQQSAQAGRSGDEIDISPEQMARMEADLLGEAGAARLEALGVVGVMRQHVISTLTVFHLAGREAGEEAWDTTPGTLGKASRPAMSPKKGGPSSKKAGSARTRSTVQPSTARTAGASSAPRVAARTPKKG